MALFKKKSVGRSPAVTPTGNSPIVRYYRPASENRKERVVSERLQKSSDASSKPKGPKKVLGILIRKSGVLLIFAALLINTTQSTSAVVKIDSSGTNIYHSNAEYEEVIEGFLKDSLLYRSKFTLRSNGLEKKIQDAFAEVESASVVIPLAGRRLQVGLTVTDPLVRLQRNEDTDQGIVGSNGVFLFEAEASKINAQFAALPSLALPDIRTTLGDQILTSQEVELVSLLKSEFDGSSKYRPKLKSIEFTVQKREMVARFEGTNMYAKLTPEHTVREQVGALVATNKQLTEKGKPAREYIDVRVEGRVFVK